MVLYSRRPIKRLCALRQLVYAAISSKLNDMNQLPFKLKIHVGKFPSRYSFMSLKHDTWKCSSSNTTYRLHDINLFFLAKFVGIWRFLWQIAFGP